MMPRVLSRADPTQRLPNRRRVRPRPVRCAICRTAEGLLHFCLLLPLLSPTGQSTTRGAGAIDLCAACWRLATDEGRIRARPEIGVLIHHDQVVAVFGLLAQVGHAFF